MTSSGAIPLNVDTIHAAPAYAGSGDFTSCALDAGDGNAWQTLAWQADLPANTAVGVQARTSLDALTWSAWSDVLNSGDAVATLGRFLQYRLLLSTSDMAVSPQVNQVSAVFGGATLPTATPLRRPVRPLRPAHPRRRQLTRLRRWWRRLPTPPRIRRSRRQRQPRPPTRPYPRVAR
ncbi:MAG: hypothetical protein R2873_36345 [Caldilineaceae bacterium]